MNYFNTPSEAVDIITELILNEDWSKLTSYYDLEGLNIDKEKMLSGEYFASPDSQKFIHPGLPSKYQVPFPPGFKYTHYEEGSRNIIKVWMRMEIDQGNGEMQIGLHTFLLIKKNEGYQIVYN